MDANARPSVLLLGTDRYVLDACVREDVDVVVCRGPAAHDNGLVQIPEGFVDLLVEDQRSPEAVLAGLARAGLSDRRFDAIQTTFEHSLVTAGVLAQVLGSRAIDPCVGVRFRDKYVQKRIVQDAGVPVTRTLLVSDIRDAERAEELPFPRAVLKPVAGAGTALTMAVNSAAELQAAARRCREQQPGARVFLLEEHVGADEWVVDGVLVDGEVRFYCLGRYERPCLITLEEHSTLRMYRMDRSADAWAYALAEPVVNRALAALGLRNGVFHMEIFADVDTETVLFSECAARRGGGLIQEEVLAKFGVDLGLAALRCALGRDPLLDETPCTDAVGTTYLNSASGVLLSCPTPEDLQRQPGVRFARLEKPLGSRLSGVAGDTEQRLGAALLAAPTVAQLLAQMEEVATWFTEHVIIAPISATPRELRAWQASTWPDLRYDDMLFSRS